MVKGKHSYVLSGITINQGVSGKAVAWCPAQLDGEGRALPVPPIGQLIHVPMYAKKPVQGVHIEPTTVFLTRKLGEMTKTVHVVDEFEAEQAEQWQQDDDNEANQADQERPRRRRRLDNDRSAGSSCGYYEPVDIDYSLFPANKYRGKYADDGEGDL